MSNDTAKKKNCDYNNYKRTRYFHGMLLTEREFQEEQIYHQEKRRLLNRKLHGWGVVCGLGVTATTPESSKIVINPGMALDCLGNEIVVCHDFELDVKKLLCPGDEPTAHDPCAEMAGQQDCKYYIGIKYTEAPTDPVPVYVPGGSCEEKACDYSRIREGYCVDLLKCVPCHAVSPQDGLFEKILACKGDAGCIQKVLQAFQATFCQQPYPCPVCCCDGHPYVILGSLDLSATKCVVTTINQNMIDINDERRYVMTFMFWNYYLGSFSPQISEFLDNPFTQICKTLNRLSAPERAGIIGRMTSANKMDEAQAKDELKKNNLSYGTTVTFTPGSAMDFAARAIAIDKIEPKARFDLVKDSSGKVLFSIPAKAQPETVDIATLRKDMEAKIAALTKKHADEIQNLGKRLEGLTQTVKDLQDKLPR